MISSIYRSKRTTISFQYHINFGAAVLNGKVQKVRGQNLYQTGSKRNHMLNMTLHRYKFTSTEIRQMCITKTIENIEEADLHIYSD